jgi:LexA-binding, inner membrane-associated putative hydrolase
VNLFIIVSTTFIWVLFLNLASHIFFAGVVTAVFTGNPYFALLAGIGSFIPDLDREYIFVSSMTFRDEQFHRALFHNLLFLSGLFLVNVWLALGAFLHSFLDSFTTEKDRGVEWLFPFSRLVKRGRFTLAANSKGGGCNLELVDTKPPDRVVFINEDSPEATKLSDPDLKEYRAVPWRRTYGPAANGQLFDKWLAVASLSLFVLYALVNPNFALAAKNLLLSTQIIPPMSLLTGIVLFFLGGWIKKNKKNRKLYTTFFIVGIVFFVISAALSINGVLHYAFPLNPTFILAASAVLSVEALLVWRLSTRKGKQATV